MTEGILSQTFCKSVLSNGSKPTFIVVRYVGYHESGITNLLFLRLTISTETVKTIEEATWDTFVLTVIHKLIRSGLRTSRRSHSLVVKHPPYKRHCLLIRERRWFKSSWDYQLCKCARVVRDAPDERGNADSNSATCTNIGVSETVRIGTGNIAGTKLA